MTPQKMKDIMTEVFMRVDSDYLQADNEQFWEIFSHINELLDAELEGRLMITPSKKDYDEALKKIGKEEYIK